MRIVTYLARARIAKNQAPQVVARLSNAVEMSIPLQIALER
jgi:hypothetical protein